MTAYSRMHNSRVRRSPPQEIKLQKGARVDCRSQLERHCSEEDQDMLHLDSYAERASPASRPHSAVQRVPRRFLVAPPTPTASPEPPMLSRMIDDFLECSSQVAIPPRSRSASPALSSPPLSICDFSDEFQGHDTTFDLILSSLPSCCLSPPAAVAVAFPLPSPTLSTDVFDGDSKGLMDDNLAQLMEYAASQNTKPTPSKPPQAYRDHTRGESQTHSRGQSPTRVRTRGASPQRVPERSTPRREMNSKLRANKDAVQEAQKEVEACRLELRDLRDKYEAQLWIQQERESQVLALTAALQERDDTIAKLKSSLEASRYGAQALRAEVVGTLKKTLKERDRTIINLSSALEEAKGGNQSVREEVHSLLQGQQEMAHELHALREATSRRNQSRQSQSERSTGRQEGRAPWLDFDLALNQREPLEHKDAAIASKGSMASGWNMASRDPSPESDGGESTTNWSGSVREEEGWALKSIFVPKSPKDAVSSTRRLASGPASIRSSTHSLLTVREASSEDLLAELSQRKACERSFDAVAALHSLTPDRPTHMRNRADQADSPLREWIMGLTP